ncbi:MAG: hypothetical protein RMK74_05920 [Myxococcales bacterium]|nr:hypothetical protein [Myxococcales bacterium]
MASRAVREISGVAVLLVGLGALGAAVWNVRVRDWVAAILLMVVGLSLVRAASEMLRPSIGE